MKADKDSNTEEGKGGGSGIGWVLLLILAVLAVRVLKIGEKIVDTPENDLASGGGGSSDGVYVDDVIVDIGGDGVSDGGGEDTGGGGSNGSGSGSSGAGTYLQKEYAANKADVNWQYQKSRLNLDLLSDYQKAQVEKGAVSARQLKSMADSQQVRAGALSAYDAYGGAEGYNISREAVESVSEAFQTSATTVLNRALAYYANLTGTHRGALAIEGGLTAWDEANKKAALIAYADANGSGWQADTARAMAAKINGTIATPTEQTTAKSSTSSTAATKVSKAATERAAKEAAAKLAASVVKAAATGGITKAVTTVAKATSTTSSSGGSAQPGLGASKAASTASTVAGAAAKAVGGGAVGKAVSKAITTATAKAKDTK